MLMPPSDALIVWYTTTLTFQLLSAVFL